MQTSKACVMCGGSGVLTVTSACAACNGFGRVTLDTAPATDPPPLSRLGKATFEWGVGPRDNASWGLTAAEGAFNAFEDKEPVYIVPAKDFDALIAERDELVRTLDLALEAYADDHNNVASERDSLKIQLTALEVPELQAD